MGTKRASGETDAGWLMACWDWAADVAEGHGPGVQIGLSPTKRPGVWRVTVRTVEVIDGRASAVRTQVRGEWPNGDRVEFLPYVHRLLMELDRLEAATPFERAAEL